MAVDSVLVAIEAFVGQVGQQSEPGSRAKVGPGVDSLQVCLAAMAGSIPCH